MHSDLELGIEGPEGVKWELGFALFLHWESGILVTGTGNHKNKIGNGKNVYTLHSMRS